MSEVRSLENATPPRLTQEQLEDAFNFTESNSFIDRKHARNTIREHLAALESELAQARGEFKQYVEWATPQVTHYGELTAQLAAVMLERDGLREALKRHDPHYPHHPKCQCIPCLQARTL